jgi:hypothetical protein
MAEQVYSRLETEWDATAVPDRERLMAISAIYAGIAYTTFGEFFCEVTADSGPLMAWNESLALGEQWFTRALDHITTAGDFAVGTGISTSARQMATLLRARARFAQNTPAKNNEAVLDAQTITQGFRSNVTREAGAERPRNNRVYTSHVGLGWIALLGPVDWWTGAADPVTGTPWPAVIPYTGYWNLAIQADGRAVSDAGYPITTSTAGSVADTRVPVQSVAPSGIGTVTYPRWEQRKYLDAGADYALAKWEEARLIEAQVTGGATAITLVNQIRAAHSLPQITYLAAGDAAGIRNMLLEEARRTFFLEGGRWWSHKLRYNLWFPRGEDVDNWNFTYQTGVRMVFPDAEYSLNPNLTIDAQGASCPPFQDPT